MKKTGFTLAEVLITLSIIGVVAMMTLPALMTNVQEQQAKTGIKKGINTFTEAAQMNQAVLGFGYSDFDNYSYEEDAQSIFGLLLARTQVDASKSTIDIDSSGNASSGTQSAAAQRVLTGKADGGQNKNFSVLFFRDGSALAFRNADTVNAATTYTNLAKGFIGYYDVNGDKAPNMLSNCGGELNVHIKDKANTTTIGEDTLIGNTENCATKNSRIIKDQFELFFGGANVVPASVAAKWAYDN